MAGDASESTTCFLCTQSHPGSVNYGEMLRKEDMAVHQFCLLFSSKLYAEDTAASAENIENSLDSYKISKIKEYVDKYKHQICIFCEGRSATIQCHLCIRRFHYKCAFDSEKCNFKFDTLYYGFCPTHTVRPRLKPKKDDLCIICHADLGERSICGQISLNCRPYMFMHRNCAILLASTQGYAFSCPICGEKEVFQKYICLRGVFIPNCDTLTQAHNLAVQETQTKYCEAEFCLEAKSLKDKQTPDKLITAEVASMKCGYCGKVFHSACAKKQGTCKEQVSDEEMSFICSSCMTLSDHELSVSSTSSDNNLNQAFDLDSHSDTSVITVVASSGEKGSAEANTQEEEGDLDSEAQFAKKFKFDYQYEWQPCHGYHNKEWRQFKLNLFMNTLRTTSGWNSQKGD